MNVLINPYPVSSAALPIKQREKRQTEGALDIQEILQEKVNQGTALAAMVDRVLDASNEQNPVLEFLEQNQDIPESVRIQAESHRIQLKSYVGYLVKVRSVVGSWTLSVRAALEDAERAGDHQRVDPVTDWRSVLAADHAAPIQSAYRQLDALGARGVDFSVSLKNFLAARHQYLGAGDDIGKCYLPAGNGLASTPIPEALLTLNFQTAYYAKWDVQAQLFQLGQLHAHNLNLRRFTFFDGSFVDIQAHQPTLDYGNASDAIMGGVGAACAVGFAAAGAALGGLVVAGVMGAYGAGVGSMMYSIVRPNDATWQGYTARYYSEADPHTPWGVRQFYGWKNSRQNLADVCNFADDPAACSWWAWRQGVDAPRDAAFDGTGQSEYTGDGQVPLLTRANQLVQALAAFAPSGAGAVSAPIPPEDARGLSLTTSLYA
jgi:hypothetical protein